QVLPADAQRHDAPRRAERLLADPQQHDQRNGKIAMQKVITVDLNGNAYQLDEDAYDALRTYLNLADVRLKDNPDRAAILADFEQAIAEKCRRFLGPNKTVVAGGDMQQIVSEMGPVESSDGRATHAEEPDAGPAASAGASAGGAARKRLFRLREGAMWA